MNTAKRLLLMMGGGGETIEVYILLGDSITRGRSVPEIAGPTPDADTVYEWDGSALVEITTDDLADAEGGSAWPQHGIDRNTATGKKIYYSNSGRGGSTITDKDSLGRVWSATGPGSLWQGAVDKAAGLLALPNVVLKGVIISGGANDFRELVKPTAAEFKTAYQDLIDRINTEWSNPDIFLFQIVGFDVGNFGETLLSYDMRKRILELEEENDNVYIAHNSLGFFSQGLISTDFIHFIQDGNNKCGEQISNFQNFSGLKRLRRIWSGFSTPISASHKNAWQTFIEACEANGNLTSIEFLQVYVSSTDFNRKMEFIGIGIPQADGATHTPNSHVSTNGTSTHIGAGYVPGNGKINAAQDDIIVGVKVKTTTTPGTTTACIFGCTGANQFYLLQGSTGLQYRVNDTTATLWNGKTKPSDNTWLAIGRNGTTKFLMEDATEVHSAVVASTGTLSRPMAVGARGNNFGASPDLFCAGEWEAFFACRWTTLTSYSDLLSDLDTLLAALKS